MQGYDDALSAQASRNVARMRRCFRGRLDLSSGVAYYFYLSCSLAIGRVVSLGDAFFQGFATAWTRILRFGLMRTLQDGLRDRLRIFATAGSDPQEIGP
jgi:hypothetical protein